LAALSLRTPFAKLITLELPAEPITWKCISAKYPDPLTPDRPGMFCITLIVPGVITRHISTGIVVPFIRPPVTLSASRTFGA
jgi:hypothetical protein